MWNSRSEPEPPVFKPFNEVRACLVFQLFNFKPKSLREIRPVGKNLTSSNKTLRTSITLPNLIIKNSQF